MKKAVLFDLDGTLIDSAPDLLAALNHVLGKAGHNSVGLSDVLPMMGDGAVKLLERGLQAGGSLPEAALMESMIREFLDFYESNISLHTRPFPGVIETLQVLKKDGWVLAVCTNKTQHLTDKVLDELDLAGYFDAVVGPPTSGTKKPDPEHLLFTLKTLAISPGRAVMVGDSHNDVDAARAAGIPSVVVSYGYSKAPVESLGAERVITAFAALPAALKSLDTPLS